jgi:hypothetical protein
MATATMDSAVGNRTQTTIISASRARSSQRNHAKLMVKIATLMDNKESVEVEFAV